MFEGRNGIVGEDAAEPIVPFHLAVRGAGGLLLRREATGGVPPRGRDTTAGPHIAAAIGNVPPRVFRARRRRALQAAREQASDEVTRVALDKRMRDFDDNVGGGIAESLIGFALGYSVVLDGPSAEVLDPAGTLGGAVSLTPWKADLWFGAFDADALCMFVRGTSRAAVRPRGPHGRHHAAGLTYGRTRGSGWTLARRPAAATVRR